MRHINLDDAIASVLAEIVDNLNNQTTALALKEDAEKKTEIDAGTTHWSPIKPYFEAVSSRKCWYTESKNPGCLNDVEHYRPKGKSLDKDGNVLHWYWFLAFSPSNYRLSAQIPNRLNKNTVLGKTGGKGNQFPLLNNTPHAENLAELPNEDPVLLDPCNTNDVELLAFGPDGRPTLAPVFSGDALAKSRVEQSNLLLNLDYPTFNEDRERLYNKVEKLVFRGDDYYAAGNAAALTHLKNDLSDLMAPDEAYSKAAECYIRGFRDRIWIDNIFT